ncbi:MAG: hypothetical protein Q4B94_04575 [Pseudomonadota bacterium]|nr:hypothetical protein [Pseudomonadota bacterium]
MNEIDEARNELWETGALGASPEHARVAKGASARLDAATNMRLVTMRLPNALVDTLKDIASHHGVGYQPMVRDLLMRFAVSELRAIRREQEDSLMEFQQSGATSAVDAFLEREKKVA